MSNISTTKVWQIAQRDYKFGKGKHSSLTKATYDAVGDKFRSLWGKEAGWAHSVLFTADLRTFSDRLKAKVEITEIKEEGPSEVVTEHYLKTEVSPLQKVKREFEDDEFPASVQQVTAKRVKRKRKA